MESFGLEFENDIILGDLDFEQSGMGIVNMGGSGLDSPGFITIGTPTGVPSLGSFPGVHNGSGSSGNNQSTTSGTNSDMNNAQNNEAFNDDDGMIFGNDMPKPNDDKSKTQHLSHGAPGMNRTPQMNHDKNNQGASSLNNQPGGQQNMGNNNMHQNNLMGARKDSSSDAMNSSRPNAPPGNQNNNSTAPKPGNGPNGPRMSESSDPSSLLSTLLLPDNPGSNSMGGPSNMPGGRPHINNQNGPNAPNGGHHGLNQYNPMGQQPYGQQQRGGMMMGNPNAPGGQMYGGYNQPPPQMANQPRAPYQLHRTMSMNSAPNGGIVRQNSVNSTNFPTNYEEELAKLKSMISAQPDLIPPPNEVLRVTQQQCLANMQRLQMQNHNPNGPGNYMPPHMQGNMPPNNTMPPGYRGQMPNQPPTAGPPTGSQPPVMGMDPSMSRNGSSAPTNPTNPNLPGAPPSASPIPSGPAPPGRPGVSPPTAGAQNQLTNAVQIPPGGGPPGQQMVTQPPGNKTNNVWQSESDVPLRRKMIAKIVSLLQQRKPDAPTEWIRRLPDMARRLEDSLYRTASNRDVYGNFNTLKTRLQHLAVTMGARAAKGNALGSPSENAPAPSGAPAIMAPGQPSAQPPQAGSNAGRPGGPPGSAPPGFNPAAGGQQPGNNQGQQGRINQQMQQHQMQMQMQQANQRQMGAQQGNKPPQNQPPGNQPQRPGVPTNSQNINPSMGNGQNPGSFQRAMNGQPSQNQNQQQQQQQRPMYPGQQQNNGPNRVPSPNPGMRTSMTQPPAAQRSQSNPSTATSRLSEALSDMDSTDFLGDLGIGDDGSDLTDDPIDALMRGSDASSSKEKKSPDAPASPSKGGPKRPMPTQLDNQAAKRAKAPTKRTPPRNNSASPPVVKTPPPSGPPSNPGGQKQTKTPPPVNK